MNLAGIMNTVAQVAIPSTTNWTVVWSILAALIPILISIVTIVVKLNSEKTKISEEAFRESSFIKDLQNRSQQSENKIINISNDINQKITQNVGELTERIKEANNSREVLRIENMRSIEQNRQSVEELRNIVYSMRSDLEIMKKENAMQEKSLEDLKQDNKELVSRLEGLIKELYEYLNSSN